MYYVYMLLIVRNICVDRKDRRKSRDWHVTLRPTHPRNSSSACYGVLLSEDWALTRQTCTDKLLPETKSSISVKVGRKHARDIILSVDHVGGTNTHNFDLRLLRLAKHSKSSTDVLPCLLTHSQFHQLSQQLRYGVYTSRTNRGGKWRLVTKRGKLLSKCDSMSDICVRATGVKNVTGFHVQGSPLSLQYEGMWYLAGLGSVVPDVHNVATFTPLWGVSNWLANTMHEIDSKCTFEMKAKNKTVTCKQLSLDGHLHSKYLQSMNEYGT